MIRPITAACASGCRDQYFHPCGMRYNVGFGRVVLSSQQFVSRTSITDHRGERNGLFVQALWFINALVATGSYHETINSLFPPKKRFIVASCLDRYEHQRWMLLYMAGHDALFAEVRIPREIMKNSKPR